MPRAYRKEGARALEPVNIKEGLDSRYVLPQRKTNCTFVESHKTFFVPPSNGKGKAINFHSMGNMEQPSPGNGTLKRESNERKRLVFLQYSKKVHRMLKKAVLDPDACMEEEMFRAFEQMLTESQHEVLAGNGTIDRETQGLGYCDNKQKAAIFQIVSDKDSSTGLLPRRTPAVPRVSVFDRLKTNGRK